MKLRPFLIAALATTVILSCSGENKKRGADYSKFKTEMKFEGEKAKNFEAITGRFDAERKSVRDAMGENPDRVAIFTKLEQIQKKQDEEVKAILTPDEFTKYKVFVDENTRKRPRYNEEILGEIKTEAGLSDEQMKTVAAANNAFEKAFMDAHDIYHGNVELAKEYWDKFDVQRKEAIKKVLTPEQNAKFLEIVKDQKLKIKE